MKRFCARFGGSIGSAYITSCTLYCPLPDTQSNYLHVTNFLETPYIFGIHNCIYINHISVSHHVILMCSVLVIAKGCLGAQSVLSKGFNGSKQTTIKIALTLKLSKESPTGWKTRQEVSSLLDCFHFNAEIRIGIPEWLRLSLVPRFSFAIVCFCVGRYSAVDTYLSYSESE